MISQLKLIGYCVGGFVILCLVIALQMEKRHSLKLEGQNRKLSAELARITTKADEQKAVTKQTVEKAKIIYRDADNVARRIETAPVVGKCETPATIMGADL